MFTNEKIITQFLCTEPNAIKAMSCLSMPKYSVHWCVVPSTQASSFNNL